MQRSINIFLPFMHLFFSWCVCPCVCALLFFCSNQGRSSHGVCVCVHNLIPFRNKSRPCLTDQHQQLASLHSDKTPWTHLQPQVEPCEPQDGRIEGKPKLKKGLIASYEGVIKSYKLALEAWRVGLEKWIHRLHLPFCRTSHNRVLNTVQFSLMRWKWNK